MQRDLDDFYAKLELAGEDAVREKFLQRAYGTDKRPLVEDWLRRKMAKRNEAANARAETREEVHVDLAKEANDIAKGSAKTARDAYRMSILSVVVAVVAALIAALAYLGKA
jgi:hypothetical protein